MIGIADIDLIQGSTAIIRLTFEDLLQSGLTPLDLRDFDSIELDVKKEALIDSPVLLSLVIGTGLTIIGENHNILEILFNRAFPTIDIITLRYDILFIKNQVFTTLVGGQINLTKVVTI